MAEIKQAALISLGLFPGQNLEQHHFCEVSINPTQRSLNHASVSPLNENSLQKRQCVGMEATVVLPSPPCALGNLDGDQSHRTSRLELKVGRF